MKGPAKQARGREEGGRRPPAPAPARAPVAVGPGAQAPLPIDVFAPQIVAAVRDHQVVVVEGAAGCGKTTGLPGMLIEAGLCRRRIGITQPRRIAAVSVAWRLAALRASPLGEEVGYSIRFDDRTCPETRIKIMTDGILLQEARHDPWLDAYDVIMIDEAHERSLNIDFVLGLVYRAIARREDLRVVVSSATLDAQVFQRFFAPLVPTVPRVHIEARTFPIAVQHRPPASGSFEALNEAVVEAVIERTQLDSSGHILVFLAGEANIQRVIVGLEEANLGPRWRVMPLFGRLKRQEQEAVFDDLAGVLKIILATNIAETSITVPGVRTVIDTGLAKVPNFHAKSGVTTLREEPISQAAATQRAGRAGRDGPGTVVRLWSDSAWATRPAFTPEEIKRVDLSEAVLRLIDLGVRDVEHFALPTAPPPGQLAEALAALAAMGAITQARELTDIGRQMVPYPLSPPLARMLVEAGMHAPEALVDVGIIGAFLSVRAPFVTPSGQEWEARRAHRRLGRPEGDAITALAIFRAWQGSRDRGRFCRQHFLDPDTMAFIDRAQAQLVDIAQSHGLAVPAAGAPPARPATVVKCLAKGFANRVLRRRGPTYETLGGLRVALHPSSALFHDPPPLVVAAELMHARRLYGFFASALAPGWLADINPEAAAAWGTGGRAPSGPRPTKLELGGVELAVEGRRRPVVLIAAAQVPALVAAGRRPDADAAGLKCRLVGTAGETWLKGRLAQVIEALPHLPIPDARAPRLPLPWGAVLEVDRNLHALLSFVERLGAPASPPGDGAPGWLGLTHNGAGGFWFQLYFDYADCLEDAAAALEAVLNEAATLGLEGDPDLVPVRETRRRLQAVAARLGL